VRPDWLSISRWRGLIHELAKFGTIGVINLVINFAVFNLLILTVLADGQLKAKAAATVVATTCAYFMNRHWTYRDRPKSTLRREYSLFFFFNLVGLVELVQSVTGEEARERKPSKARRPSAR